MYCDLSVRWFICVGKVNNFCGKIIGGNILDVMWIEIGEFGVLLGIKICVFIV